MPPVPVVINAVEIDTEEDPKHKFAKLILGTAAGYLATNFVEGLYDKILQKYRESKTTTQ